MSDTKNEQPQGLTIPIPEIEDFEGKIVQAAVHHLLYETVVGDGEEPDGYTISTSIHTRLQKEIVATIKEQAREQTPKVVEQILAGSVSLTDDYGYDRGKSKTVTELIAETVKDEAYNGNTGRRGGGVLAGMIQEEVRKQFRGELKEAVDSAKSPLLEAVREEAVRAIEMTMANALKGVKG